MFGRKNNVEPKVERWLASDFAIRETWDVRGSKGLGMVWGVDGYWAGVTVKTERENGMVRKTEYSVKGETPETALFALKKAVAEGEEGWTW